jgi:stearoyl-CoA desaturase (delta-9 desaturase)
MDIPMRAIDSETIEKEELIRPPYEMRKLVFVWLIHGLLAAFSVLWILDYFAFSWGSVALAIGWFVVSSTAITAGYHRLFSHAAYRAKWPLELFYLITGASAFQGPALQWSAQHRDHHTYVDQPKDPYNITMGFWFAHMGWVVRQTNPNYDRVKDLSKSSLVQWQVKNYYPIAFLASFIVPTLIGAMWGEALGAFFMVGLVRLVIQWHMTFCVNSVAHYWGSQKYSTNHTARGSWWLSFITWGEMDHNFHHTFPSDFRTGTRWYDFDPGKWVVWTSEKVGLAFDLKKMDDEKIVRAMERTKNSE